jgi:hypothetical protein
MLSVTSRSSIRITLDVSVHGSGSFSQMTVAAWVAPAPSSRPIVTTKAAKRTVGLNFMVLPPLFFKVNGLVSGFRVLGSGFWVHSENRLKAKG